MPEIIFKDVVAEGLSRLLTQWDNSPNIQNLLATYLETFAEIELTLKDLNEKRSVFTAAGAQLDDVGVIVGEARLNREDDAYRLAILNRIAANNSDGTPNDIIQVMQALTQVDDVRLVEYESGHFFITVGENVSEDFIDVLSNISPAGVSSTLLVHEDSNMFTFAHYAEDLRPNSYLPHYLETDVINPLCQEKTRSLAEVTPQAGEVGADAGEPFMQATEL